jgi:hypothetical protein
LLNDFPTTCARKAARISSQIVVWECHTAEPPRRLNSADSLKVNGVICTRVEVGAALQAFRKREAE